MKRSYSELNLLLIIIGIAMNIGLTTLVNLLKVPIYVDAVGTIIVTILVGLRSGIITGVSSFIIMTITLLGPYHIYFSGTQIVIALITYYLGNKGMFKSVPRVIIVGIILGIAAAIASAPVIVYLFGGVEGNGPGLITSFLIATGKTIGESVILKGISVEPIDKTIQCLIAFSLLKGLPEKILRPFTNKIVVQNFKQ